jgi:hypothetical protein
MLHAGSVVAYIGGPGPAEPPMQHYAAVVGYAFWCQSTALVLSAVAQTLAGGWR